MSVFKMRQHPGFTIVELLIVIVIIGILATLVIAVYNGIQNRAYDTTVQTDLNNVGKKIKAYIIDTGTVPKDSQLSALNLKVGKSAYSRGFNNGASWYNFVYCWPNTSGPEDFALVAQSKSGNVFEYNTRGTVKQATYAFTGGSMVICSSAGNTMATGSDRTFLYDTDAWQSFVAT